MPDATTRTRKPASERRAEMAQAAMDLVAEGGLENLTTARLADRIGLSQAAIFRHFATKQALWQAIFAGIEARAAAAWDAADAPDLGPVDGIRALVGAQIALIAATPAMPALAFSPEAHRPDQAVRPPMASMMRRFSRRLEARIARGQAVRALRRDVSAPDAAMLLIGLVQGLVMRWSLTGRGFDLREEGARLVEIQLRCLAAGGAEAA